MTLSDVARDRLADVVELQPTKNGELQDRWELDSGSEVHQFLESELSDYNSLIRATSEANDMVDVEPGVEGEPDAVPSVVRVPELQARILDVLAGPDERSESVVSVLHAVREAFDVDADADTVRSGLQSLRRKGVVEVEYRSVPTFRLTAERDSIDVEVSD